MEKEFLNLCGKIADWFIENERPMEVKDIKEIIKKEGYDLTKTMAFYIWLKEYPGKFVRVLRERKEKLNR